MVMPDLNFSPPVTQEEQILEEYGHAIDEDAVPENDQDALVDKEDEAMQEQEQQQQGPHAEQEQQQQGPHAKQGPHAEEEEEEQQLNVPMEGTHTSPANKITMSS